MSTPRTTWQSLCPSRYWRHPALDSVSACLDDPETQAEIDSLELEGAYPAPILYKLQRAALSDLFDPLPRDRKAAGQPHFTLLNVLAARQSGALGITLGVNGLALLPVHIAGNPTQLERVSQRVREGAFAAILLTELDAGSDLARNRASAEPGVLSASGDFVRSDEPTHFRLTGEKQLINGGTRHELLVALFRTLKTKEEGIGCAPSSAADFTFFLLERGPGITTMPPWRLLPCPSADIAGVRFDGFLARAAEILGGVGEGFGIVQRTLTISRGAVSGLSAGAATRARELATEYACARQLYGAPIVMLDPIAQHLCRLEALDVLVASLSVKQALAINAYGPGAAHLSAVAKYACSRLAEEAVDEGRRVLSARAFFKNGAYERLIRDVPLYGVFDGTGHVMLEQIRWRLEQWTALFSHEAPDSSVDLIALTTKYYVTEPRSLTLTARHRGRAPLVPLDHHARSLVGHAATYPLALIAELAGLLGQMTRALREHGQWEADGAVRFELAHIFAMLETLCATAELGDSGCRAALGIGAFECDSTERERLECAGRFGVGWLGARLVSELRALWFRMGETGRGSELDPLERAFLQERDSMEKEMRTRLRRGFSR